MLDATKSPVLSTIIEDAPAPVGAVGTLVSTLVDFASPAGQVDNVTDVDGTALGIALTGVTGGTLWFSTNSGGLWTQVVSVSDASAILLAANATTRVYFQPSANSNGTVTNAITFRAWDQSTGTATARPASTFRPTAAPRHSPPRTTSPRSASLP